MAANYKKIVYIMERTERNANLCAVCYKLISDAPENERGNLLQLFFDNYENEPDEKTLVLPTAIEEDDEYETVKHLLAPVTKAVNALLERKLPENEFYEQLWAYISASEDLRNDMERICSLIVINLSDYIPYFPISEDDMVSMEQNEYVESMEILKTNIKRMDRLIRCDFSQKTQQASLLLRELEQIPDFRLRTVYLSQLMVRYRAKSNMGSLLGDLALRSLLEKDDDE